MSPSKFDLTGKVALVSGAAQGLGRSTALALAEAGADAMLVDRNEAGARATGAIIEKLGRRAVVAGCDVSEPVQIRQLFKQLDAQFDRIDFLGNIAATVCWEPRKRSHSKMWSAAGETWCSAASACARKQDAACWPQAGAA